MNTYNLFAPFGSGPLNYPHYTKWRGDTVHIVTTPENKIEIGDSVMVALEIKNGFTGEIKYSYYHRPAIVKSISEERLARGNHLTDFKPIFQKVVVA